MIPYQKEKFENAVCFFAKEHYRKTRHHLYQTFLYKYIALFDFGYLRAYGKPALGLTYRAMKMGPVPLDIYDLRHDKTISKNFMFKEDAQNHLIIIPKCEPNLDYFSKREVDLMKKLIEIYAQGYVSSRIMSDASHQEILAWKKTWAKTPNSIIDFSLEFSGNIFEKSIQDLTFPEEVFLVHKGLENCI